MRVEALVIAPDHPRPEAPVLRQVLRRRSEKLAGSADFGCPIQDTYNRNLDIRTENGRTEGTRHAGRAPSVVFRRHLPPLSPLADLSLSGALPLEFDARISAPRTTRCPAGQRPNPPARVRYARRPGGGDRGKASTFCSVLLW